MDCSRRLWGLMRLIIEAQILNLAKDRNIIPHAEAAAQAALEA
jgi:hypothetical protein